MTHPVVVIRSLASTLTVSFGPATIHWFYADIDIFLINPIINDITVPCVCKLFLNLDQ